MPRKTLFLAVVLFIFGFLLGMPFYHIPTFTKGPLICALIGQEKNVFEIFTQSHLWTYRPLLVLMFSTLYKLFGFHYEPYRIFAAAFSGFFALFVYLFLVELHPSRKIAFFSTLIFTLTTPFLDGLWDLSEAGFYSTCLFYGAFLFFVKLSKCDGNHKLENRYTFLFLFLSLLSLLTKETTRAMAPPILFLYCYFLKANKKQWKLFWIFCGLSVLTLLPVLSAPSDPGSRAAVTTPFWEVAKIVFQINVTQLMSIFHLSLPLPLLIYGIMLYASRLRNLGIDTSRIFPLLKKAALFDIATGVFSWNLAPLLVVLFVLHFRTPDYITYFSAKYFPQNSFWMFDILGIILFASLTLIFLSRNKMEMFLCSSIIFTFLSYYAEMTFIPAFRLEPSSRHYLLILPFLCYFIALAVIKIFDWAKPIKWWQKTLMYPAYAVILFLLAGTLIFSAVNLNEEFQAIGSTEFKAWNAVVKQGLKDTVVFSPADGYALPPEYLKLAAPNEHFVSFQLPRWFASKEDFESYLRRTIDEQNMKSAKKIFYYSSYGSDPFHIGGPDGSDLIYEYQSKLAPQFAIYDKIGYWKHIFSMHGVLESPLETYLSQNAKLIYEKQQKFQKHPSVHKYIARVYIQNNEPKQK